MANEALRARDERNTASLNSPHRQLYHTFDTCLHSGFLISATAWV